jgi:hypothetical protein
MAWNEAEKLWESFSEFKSGMVHRFECSEKLGTERVTFESGKYIGPVAQLVERSHGMRKARGSKPLRSTNI